jgi:uncharacterized DUF497 family protein
MLSSCGRFEWDPQKAEANFRKHGISFEVAVAVFDDPFVVRIPDRIEDGEECWQAIGMAGASLLLVVVHTYRQFADIEVARIISARKPTRAERKLYEEDD